MQSYSTPEDIEEWRSVVSHPELYEVSSLGRIRRIATGVILKPFIHKGYGRVDLWSHSVRRAVEVQVVVAEAFLGAKPEGHEIDHKDTNKQNNAVTNLEYVTHHENGLRALRAGLMQIGEAHHHAKLTEAAVRDIRARLARREKQKDIASLYGVSPAAIRHIKIGETWAHVS